MTIAFFDAYEAKQLQPLTLTRPTGEIRCGIRTLKEKWLDRLPECKEYGYHTQQHLAEKYKPASTNSDFLINPCYLANDDLVAQMKRLAPNTGLATNGNLIVFRGEAIPENPELLEYSGDTMHIEHPWHIFMLNGQALEEDFELLTRGRKSAKLSNTNTVIGDRIFVEEGVKAECAVFNTTTGPIYLDKNSEVMEGSVIRGGLYLGQHAGLKLSTKIYGPTTIGPHSKVGGEVNNSVIFGLSNKGHDGFLGNAVLGEWCNIGADSNNSNLKNNYEEVKLWSMEEKRFVRTGTQFCGLIMGDHSKCGINTMFNTGTVVGVSANIFGAGFPRNYIPSFSWGGAAGFTEYKLEKALETAERVMIRRGIELDEVEKNILKWVFDNRN
jgi:UDP-N-acetylglucosamine diphosphorylase/glucosamine-1-phosphate N-acetyltransferase